MSKYPHSLIMVATAAGWSAAVHGDWAKVAPKQKEMLYAELEKTLAGGPDHHHINMRVARAAIAAFEEAHPEDAGSPPVTVKHDASITIQHTEVASDDPDHFLSKFDGPESGPVITSATKPE